jgi:hypothetical protein
VVIALRRSSAAVAISSRRVLDQSPNSRDV